VQSGKENTLTTASVSLQVKMTNRLALAAGYQLTDNSQPPQGSERRDTLTTLNLVYELKNEKLAPE
jgi:putative salt-induced outer membrane protein YdiY